MALSQSPTDDGILEWPAAWNVIASLNMTESQLRERELARTDAAQAAAQDEADAAWVQRKLAEEKARKAERLAREQRQEAMAVAIAEAKEAARRESEAKEATRAANGRAEQRIRRQEEQRREAERLAGAAAAEAARKREVEAERDERDRAIIEHALGRHWAAIRLQSTARRRQAAREAG